MRAAVHDTYGPPEVLRIEEVDRPVPRDDEVLIRIHASTVNRTDTAFRAGRPRFARIVTGLRRPKHRILGTELAGDVDAVGAAVSEFAPGDEVFGVNAWHFGAHAEYVCMRQGAALAPKPSTMSFAEAAAVCDGAILALNCLRSARVRAGQRVLVYGASGSIGTAAVQLAACFGADVTAVCGTGNLELVRSLGAGTVIDHTRDDFTANGETYDVVVDAVGKLSFGRCRSSLAAGGVYLPTDGVPNVLLQPLTARIGSKRVVFRLPPTYTKKDVLFLRSLIEAGRYRAVIDRTYRLDDVVEANRYVDTEQKTGNVVLAVSPA